MSIIRESEIKEKEKTEKTARGRRRDTARNRENRDYDFRTDILLACVLLMWAFFVNRKFRISGLYMDDLYMWSCWGEQSFPEYVFPIGSTRCRFVYWLAAWAELLLIGNHITWIVPINILLNAGLAVFLYGLAKRLSRSRVIGFWVGFLFLSAHFSYYQIGQLLGLMETMGLAFAVAQSWFLYRWMRRENSRDFALALLFYFLNCFTHERYMVLLPMFFFCLLVKRSRQWQYWLSVSLTFLSVLGIRLLAIGTLAPAGTGGTQVAETFTRQSAAMNFLAELLYCIGVNAGPEHLSGLPWQKTPFIFKVLLLFSFLLLLLFFVMVVLDILQQRSYGLSSGKTIRDMLFFPGFMVGCAAASAVTIRVEMRWVYAVYVFWLLFISLLFGMRRRIRLLRDADPEAQHRYRISDHFPMAALLFSGILMLPAFFLYRSAASKIYLFPNQERYNSLADVSYGKYGASVLGKEIVIIGNSYEMSEFTADTFFKTFDPARTGQGTVVRHVETPFDFGLVSENMLVLQEDPAHNAFTDATELLRNVKLNAVYGYYSDGWMDEQAELRILTGSSGEITMRIMYPGNLRGDETVTVVKDEEETYSFPLQSNIAEFTLDTAPGSLAALRFTQNFHVENAAEQRGRDRLAMIVTFTAD
ncbi:MAG: hypothetical protein ACTTK0_00365 [Stomatobaculum sp.]